MTDGQHIHVCPVKGIVECRICGDTIPMPKGCLSWVIGVLHAFSNVHERCRHPIPAESGHPGCRNSDCTGFVTPKK